MGAFAVTVYCVRGANEVDGVSVYVPTVPPELSATVPVGFTQGAAQVTVKVEPVAIALLKVMATVLSTGTLIALSSGETAVTAGAMGAAATRSAAPRIESP